MEISVEMVNELRKITQISIMECKKALIESNGDINKAVEILRKRGLDIAGKKATREVKEGIIVSYVHLNNKIGVLVELMCETDFVAKSEDFKILGKEIAMQIAACNPKYLIPTEIPEDIIEKEKEIYRAQFLESGKPERVIENIVKGKLEKFYEQICLLEQRYVRDEKLKIKDLIASTISKLGENIKVSRFVRFELGEKI